MTTQQPDDTQTLAQLAERLLTANWDGFEDDPDEFTYTFLGPGALTVPADHEMGQSRVIERGGTIVVTPELIERTRDRTGRSWVEELHSDERFTPGAPGAEILAELAEAVAREAESVRIAKARQDAIYGRRAEARAVAKAEAVAEAKSQQQQQSREY